MTKIGKEYIDDLTGLYNRRYLLLEAIKKLKSAEQKGMPLSMVFIDLDHFKNVNDTYGHARGDVVLREFGEFLKRELRQNDTVYRYGGDEFICILPNADYAQAVVVSGRFMKRCRAKEFAKNRLTLSIGIASFPENAGDWKGLFELAEVYYYQGLMFKESGDKINSKKYFTKATKIFKKLGAKGWVEKISSVSLKKGAHSGHNG